MEQAVDISRARHRSGCVPSQTLHGGGKRHVLIISLNGFPPRNAEAIVSAKVAIAMKRAGWTVDFVTTPNRCEWYPSEAETWSELQDSVHIIEDARPSLTSRFTNAVRGMAAVGRLLRNLSDPLSFRDACSSLIRRQRPDAIISRCYPIAAHLAGLMLHKQTGIPWIANWDDPIPGPKFPPPYGSGANAPISRFYRASLGLIGPACPWHTFPADGLRRYMASYVSGNILERSSVIPHIALSTFHKAPQQTGRFTVLHAGYLRPPRDPKPLLKGFTQFASSLSNRDQVRLAFVVDSSEDIGALADSYGIGDLVAIHPTKPYGKMADEFSTADVLAVVEAPVAEGIFLPSKFVDYVQSGRAILALSPLKGTLNTYLSQSGGGLAVDGQSPEAVADALQKLYRAWQCGKLETTYGSSHLMTHFNEDAVLGSYETIIQRLASRR
jgi:hypothetical protein